VSVIPALRRLRQEYQEFGTSVGYILRPYLKNFLKQLKKKGKLGTVVCMLGRLRQDDCLSIEVSGQPGSHSEIPLKKREKKVVVTEIIGNSFQKFCLKGHQKYGVVA
jgi:hypothetical protein